MLGTMEDEYDNESLNNSFQAHSPSSDSIISFNPSLIGVPDSCFPSLMEDIMSPTRWDNLSPIDGKFILQLLLFNLLLHSVLYKR